MRVLWICNVILPDIAKELSIEVPLAGGWLHTLVNQLSRDHDVLVCYPTNNKLETRGATPNYSFYGFSRLNGFNNEPLSKYVNKIKELINSFKPDVLHVWGTEFIHSLGAVRAFDKPDRTIVSIQGFISNIAKHYTSNLPGNAIKYRTFRDLVRFDTILQQKKKFFVRGESEKETVKHTNHIIGRTTWDKASVLQINPSIKYHFCNESLRNTFYLNKNTWNYEKCEKQSIFVSQAGYPVKGFHQVLMALPTIAKKHPDVHVYTTGPNPFSVSWYRLSGYQKYLRELMRRNKIVDRVTFLGVLNEKEMCDQFLKSNVFVSPSSIENSPNSVGEAMLLGMPIVASYVGGTMDMLKDKEEGFLYQADAPYMLAHYVSEVFSSASSAKGMGYRAFQHASITHNLEDNYRNLLAIYKEVQST